MMMITTSHATGAASRGDGFLLSNVRHFELRVGLHPVVNGVLVVALITAIYLVVRDHRVEPLMVRGGHTPTFALPLRPPKLTNGRSPATEFQGHIVEKKMDIEFPVRARRPPAH